MEILRDIFVYALVTYAILRICSLVLFNVSYYIHEFDTKWTKQEYKAYLIDSVIGYYGVLKNWLQ